jgi:hypothetical protein
VAKNTITLHLLLVPMSLSDLCQDAPWIMGGIVREVLPSTIGNDLLTNRPIIYTDTLVEVRERYKGSLPRDTILVRTLGGETDSLSMSVAEAPRFVPREQVLLFLSKDAGKHFPLDEDYAFVIHGWSRGKYSVSGNDAISAAEGARIDLRFLMGAIAQYTRTP